MKRAALADDAVHLPVVGSVPLFVGVRTRRTRGFARLRLAIFPTLEVHWRDASRDGGHEGRPLNEGWRRGGMLNGRSWW